MYQKFIKNYSPSGYQITEGVNTMLCLLCMRVCLVHSSPQTVACHMRIDLGSRKILMAKQFLHDTQVCPVIQQVGRKTVPDHMRMDMDA
jgi:hypothetical protein